MNEVSTQEAGRLERYAKLFETLILGLLLALMLVLASTQIVLRNFFDQGLAWGDPMIRALVLWLGLLGAVVAARGDKHIRIDLLTRYLSPAWSEVLRLLGHLVTSVVATVIAWHGGRLVLLEREFASVAFSSVPAWVVQSVIPVSFGLIGLLYLLAALGSIKALWTRGR